MKTSYFSKYKQGNGISIAVGTPNWFKGEKYPSLFPKWDFLNRYKQDGDEVAYTQAYHEQVLSKLNPQQVYDDLKDKVVLCWESSEKFCHRHIVAEWLKNELGVEIKEVDNE